MKMVQVFYLTCHYHPGIYDHYPVDTEWEAVPWPTGFRKIWTEIRKEFPNRIDFLILSFGKLLV